MEKNFAKLLDENLDTLNFEIGKLITGVVVDLLMTGLLFMLV